MKLYASLVLTEEHIKHAPSPDWLKKYIRERLASKLMEAITEKIVVYRIDDELPKINENDADVKIPRFETVVDVDFLYPANYFRKVEILD